MENSSTKPGADSKITPELVYRVSELVAKGISIRLAFAGTLRFASTLTRH
jgi:hypothetical protein